MYAIFISRNFGLFYSFIIQTQVIVYQQFTTVAKLVFFHYSLII